MVNYWSAKTLVIALHIATVDWSSDVTLLGHKRLHFQTPWIAFLISLERMSAKWKLETCCVDVTENNLESIMTVPGKWMNLGNVSHHPSQNLECSHPASFLVNCGPGFVKKDVFYGFVPFLLDNAPGSQVLCLRCGVFWSVARGVCELTMQTESKVKDLCDCKWSSQCQTIPGTCACWWWCWHAFCPLHDELLHAQPQSQSWSSHSIQAHHHGCGGTSSLCNHAILMEHCYPCLHASSLIATVVDYWTVSLHQGGCPAVVAVVVDGVPAVIPVSSCHHCFLLPYCGCMTSIHLHVCKQSVWVLSITVPSDGLVTPSCQHSSVWSHCVSLLDATAGWLLVLPSTQPLMMTDH